MSIIQAPYNFVPLSDKVYYPSWAEQISQDIPFTDGLSGTIDFTIKAETPIFIRNGHKLDSEREVSFSHVDTPKGPSYFIPATSIKGEVRNLLEIMSFGKVTVDPTAMFARRDLKSQKVYPLLSNQKKVHCGWLRRKGDNFEIADCGRFWRIAQPEIDNLLGRELMRQNFSATKVEKLEDEKKTAAYKYEILSDEHKLENLCFEIIKDNRVGDHVVKIATHGSLHGTIVLTGQPSPWTEPRGPKAKGKYYEFVFPDKEEEVAYDITKEEYSHYEFIYRDSSEWVRIKKLLDSSEHGGRGVPVFFRVTNDGKIEDFGMAYLYKLPYNRSVKDSLPDEHKKDEKHDLAECLFGYTRGNDSLKGRVQFGNAFSSDATPSTKIRLVLGSPKASYYPIYIKQEGKNGITYNYDTYDSPGRIAGWKRYIPRKNTSGVKETGSDTVDTMIIPLKAGATFRETITFHNLRPVELGALLSALTFHDTSRCRHLLGMAKPYGFGKCEFADVTLHAKELRTNNSAKNKEHYMGLFEYAISESLGINWCESQQITELLTMAAANVADNSGFDYMIMSNNRKDNQFEQAKNDKEYLQSATKLLNVQVKAMTCITEEVNAEVEETRRLDAERLHKQELCDFKTSHEAQIEAAKTDNAQLNRIKSELTSITDDDEQKWQIIDELIMKIDNHLKDNKANRTFATVMAKTGVTITEYKMWETRMKAGQRVTPLDQLTPEDKELAFSKLREAYDAETNENPKSRKNWIAPQGSYFKKCSKLLGDNLTIQWFNSLNIN